MPELLLAPAGGEDGEEDSDGDLLPEGPTGVNSIESDINSLVDIPDQTFLDQNLDQTPGLVLIQPQCSPCAHENSSQGLVPAYIPRTRKSPSANLAYLAEAFSEVDSKFNMALSAIGLPPIPKSFSKAMEDPNRWSAAIQKEINRLAEFGVFGPPQTPPENATILFTLWVFVHKLNGTGDIVDEKARLVVNGSKQEEGVDYFQTFAAVLRFESLRIWWPYGSHWVFTYGKSTLHRLT